jgi:type VI secretion system protein ImpA
MSTINIDLDALTAPLNGPDGAAGQRTPGQERDKLDRDRIHRPADPDTDEPDKPADWDAVISDTQRLLRTTSKDLLLAARLVEALTKKHGFGGTRAGLDLLHGMVANCWERMYPVIRDGDVEPRAAPFRWLDDPTAGAWFPVTLRQVPLFQGRPDKPAPRSWDNWREAREAGPGKENPLFWDAAGDASADELRQTEAELIAADESLQRLANRLKEPDRMGAQAEGLTHIRDALRDCLEVTRSVIQRLPAAAPPQPGAAANPGEPSRPNDLVAIGTNRKQLYTVLRQAADQLAKMEPHSPIPYLIRRAVELGEKDFPDMIKSFVRDRNMLKELNRELGISKEGDD